MYPYFLCTSFQFLNEQVASHISEAFPRRYFMYKMFLEFLHNSQACNFIKKEPLAQVFSCEFCKISKNTFFYRTLLTAASYLSNIPKVKKSWVRQQAKSHQSFENGPQQVYFPKFFKLFRTNIPCIQNANWTYVRRSDRIQGIFWKSYLSSICVVCPGGFFRVTYNDWSHIFMATNFHSSARWSDDRYFMWTKLFTKSFLRQ